MRRSWLLIIAAIVIIPVIIGVARVIKIARAFDPALMKQQLARAPKDLADQRDAARSEGIPLDAADLALPVPPPGQNAADIYSKIAGILKINPLNPPSTERAPESPYGYTPEQIKELRKLLADRKDVLALVHHAADTKAYVYPRDWTLGANLLFPEYAPMREDARLITAESHLLALDGRYEEAVKNQTRGFAIARHAASDPTLIAYLVAIACEAIAMRGMEDILSMAGPNQKVDAEVSKAISANRVKLSLRHAMQGEVVMCEYTLRDLRRDGPDALTDLSGVASSIGHATKTPRSTEERRVFSLEMDAADAEFLRRMRANYAVADEHTQHRRDVFAANAEVAHHTGDTPVQMTSQIVLAILLPAYNQIVNKETSTYAEESIDIAAASVLAAKARTGAFPDALPGSHIDPFSGKQLGYRRDGNKGFVVYSVGEKGTFDGKPGPKRGHGFEFFYRYPISPWN